MKERDHRRAAGTGYLSEIGTAADEAPLEAVRVAALGKKGVDLRADEGARGHDRRGERKTAGALLNRAQGRVTEAIAERARRAAGSRARARLASEKLDVTLPARPFERKARVHPVSQVWEEVVQIFGDLGFAVAEGPHIED